ncbi:cation transporter [Parasphingopyxis algicola]|uniref:cation diffusion facilitator family transporter n=1 Tax=Parasphingopyxis algicola TaxID=2026624 RepID=UPI0015A4910C|nr:cation diffusion facilitator family transporter [Parasphingopyxis algicola]QLC25516.1 cation transporter [Parasphingopyxis algicola]
MGAGHSHHGHDHGHGHSHAPADFGRAFAIGIALNTIYIVVEAGYGFAIGSMSLLADAGHNLSDVLGLIIAWAGATLAKRPPSKRYTFGFRGSSILAALFNAVLLLIAVGLIALEAIQRIVYPAPVAGGTIMIVAAIGIVINGATAMLFARGRKGDINIRGAYLHMAADAAVSAGVVIAGGLILWTGANWIDPATSLVIGLVILLSTWGLLKDAVKMSLAAVPEHIDTDEVRATLEAMDGIAQVHHLHIWNMSTTETALTAHIVMPAGHPGDAFLAEVQARLADRFHIGHSTIQIERGDTPGDCDGC